MTNVPTEIKLPQEIEDLEMRTLEWLEPWLSSSYLYWNINNSKNIDLSIHFSPGNWFFSIEDLLIEMI